MTRFWLLIIALFVVLLFTVNHVSRRSSQAETLEAANPQGRPLPAAAAAPQPYQAPRSYAPTASSGALYKCVDGSGHTSFQSQPCPAGATQAWVRDATPEPEPTRAERMRRARLQQLQQRSDSASSNRRAYSPGATTASQDPGDSAACQIARAADAAYRRQPLRYVTHDGLRRHGDQVNEACY